LHLVYAHMAVSIGPSMPLRLYVTRRRLPDRGFRWDKAR
jgi:hypothetical protein